MSKITYYLLPSSSKLNEVDYQLGNLIFCEDIKRIYLDGVYGRVSYDSIVVFETDAERILYEHPFEGFYFVEETKTLWRYYEEEWTNITEPPESNVVFIPKSELPPEGEFAVLYVCDTEQYVWNPTTHAYDQINAEAVWHEV